MSAAGVYVCVRGGRVICCSFWFDSMMSSWASGYTSAMQTVTSDTNLNKQQRIWDICQHLRRSWMSNIRNKQFLFTHSSQIFTFHDSASDAIFAVHLDHLARRNVVEADDIFKDCATKQMYCTCELRTMDFSPLRFDAAIQSYWR